MTKTMIAAALFATTLGGAAQAGEYRTYTDADRAYFADSDYGQRFERVTPQTPRQQNYNGESGFGSFGGAAGTARNLGF